MFLVRRLPGTYSTWACGKVLLRGPACMLVWLTLSPARMVFVAEDTQGLEERPDPGHKHVFKNKGEKVNKKTNSESFRYLVCIISPGPGWPALDSAGILWWHTPIPPNLLWLQPILIPLTGLFFVLFLLKLVRTWEMMIQHSLQVSSGRSFHYHFWQMDGRRWYVSMRRFSKKADFFFQIKIKD